MKENKEPGTNGSSKIKVGYVNYLNTLPLVYGMTRTAIRDQIELTGGYPSKLATMLKDGEIDIGLIPIAAIPDLPEYHICGEYCIATEGEIASVALFSDVPMQEIEKIYLDYQSRSSVELLKYLMQESWGISPELVYTKNDNFRKEIKGSTAGLVIGDRAFEQRKISNFIYDLGSEWKAITGLPFVFAAWISTKEIPDSFIKLFNEANAFGLSHIDEIVVERGYPLYDLSKYFKLHLNYQLSIEKRESMFRFLNILATCEQGS